jgi:hypothetical protein
MSLIAVLARRLGMLLSTRCVLLSLRVVAFTVMFGGRAVRLSSVLVMFGCLIVFVFGHSLLQLVRKGRNDNLRVFNLVPQTRSSIEDHKGV